MALPVFIQSGIVLRRIAVLATALLPAFVINPAWIVDRIVPVTDASLDVPRSVELGELRPGQHVTASMEIRNCVARRVSLRPVESDCGCVVIVNAPDHLDAGKTATVTVSVAGPSSPGEFARSLLIGASGDSAPTWPIKVQGRVIADVWAEPSELNLELSDESTETTSLKIFHSNTLRVGSVAASSDTIEIVDSCAQVNTVQLHVRVRVGSRARSESGKALLNVFGEDNPTLPAITIPISWKPRSQIGYVPQRLDFSAFDGEQALQNELCRTVAVTVPPECLADDAKLQVLVPWVRVAEKTIHGSVLRLKLVFDREKMPDRFQQPILTARMPDEPVDRELFAAGYRTQLN